MSFLHRNIQTKSSKMRPNNFHILCKPVALTPAPCCKSRGHMPHALLQDIFERFRTQGFGLAPAIRKNIHFGDPGIADDLKDMGFMARGVGPKLWVSRRWHQSLNEQPVHGGPRGGSTSSSWWGIDLTKSKHHRQKTRNIEEIGGMGKPTVINKPRHLMVVVLF